MKLLAAALLAAALLTAGCGGSDDTDDYVKQVNSANTEHAKEITRLTAAAGALAAKPKQMAAKFEQAADVVDKVSDELAAIDPPEDAKAGHAMLVSGTRRTAEEFRAAADQAADGDVEAAVNTVSAGIGAKEYEAGLARLVKDAGIKRESQ